MSLTPPNHLEHLAKARSPQVCYNSDLQPGPWVIQSPVVPVQPPRSPHGVSAELWPGEGICPRLCVCLEMLLRGSRSNPAPAKKTAISAINGVHLAHWLGLSRKGSFLCQNSTANMKQNKINLEEMPEY